MALIEEDDARERILARIQPLPAERLPLLHAQGRFLAERVQASCAIPPFDNSAVDGFALALGKRTGAAVGERFRLIGEQPAGLDRAILLPEGSAARIYTGAPLPVGCEAVQMQEEVRCEEDGTEIVLKSSVSRGEWIRRRGGDVAEGEILIEPGKRLSSRHLALLASQGRAEVLVGRRPRAVVVTTGSELRKPGESLARGEIYESNGTLLAGLCAAAGADVVGMHGVPDDRGSLRHVLDDAAAGCEVLLLAGGMSVGGHDFARPVLAEMGMEQVFWGVNLRPGKPFLFGLLGGLRVFGFPGNPVSVYVCFLRLCLPALLGFQGAEKGDPELPEVRCRLGTDLANPGSRPHWVRGVYDGERGEFRPVGIQESHGVGGLGAANALLRVPAGVEWASGTAVRVLLLEGWTV